MVRLLARTLDFDGCHTFARLVSESVEGASTRPARRSRMTPTGPVRRDSPP